MGQLSVMIAGRSYRMACADGEEDHLEGLAQMLDAKVAGLREQFGEIGDQRLIVMAALTVADELDQLKRRTQRLEAELAQEDIARSDTAAAAETWAQSVAEALEAASVRIEKIAHNLNAAGKG